MLTKEKQIVLLDDKLSVCGRSTTCQFCIQSVQIRSFFGSIFSYIWSEYGPENTPHYGIFQAVQKNK